MVSSGVVSSDLSTLNSHMEEYLTLIGDLANDWKGFSYENLVSKAEEFSGEYLEAITSQMTAFSSACDVYLTYKDAKKNVEICEEAYRKGVEAKASNLSELGNAVTEAKKAETKWKQQVEQFLKDASSPSLSASATNVSSMASDGSTNNVENDSQNRNSTSRETVYTANSTMQSVADVASNNSGGGYDGMCELWAETQWERATGIQRETQPDAYTAWKTYGVSTSRDNIPVGAMVYGTGSGSQYGHVGIYVGDGMIADQGGVTSLDNWLSWQKTNPYGETGWLGWGWQNGIDLTQST